MGLDMYALTIDEKPEGLFEFDYADAERIYTWRKHPDLHGWMEDHYTRLGGDLEFVTLARQAIHAGKYVFYDGWWE